MSIYKISDTAVKKENFVLEQDDPTLNPEKTPSLQHEFPLHPDVFNNLFFSAYGITYISDYFTTQNKAFRVVSHPKDTNTCYEKALVLNRWDPLNVIKALYFQCTEDDSLYAVIVPETGCFIDKEHLRKVLDLPVDNKLAKARHLPDNMTFGTCSPFLRPEDLKENGGRVAGLLFDAETLISKKHDNTLDDFSFGMDHRLSIQMNYYQCYNMLKKYLGNAIVVKELLTLSFKEKLVRKKGKIKIKYEFNTLNYRTAMFINSIHGYGDVSIENDYVDELDLPDILTMANGKN